MRRAMVLRVQSDSRFRNRTFLHHSGPKQHHRLRLQLRVRPPRTDDGLNLSGEPRTKDEYIWGQDRNSPIRYNEDMAVGGWA
jgi:hypothetical protein